MNLEYRISFKNGIDGETNSPVWEALIAPYISSRLVLIPKIFFPQGTSIEDIVDGLILFANDADLSNQPEIAEIFRGASKQIQEQGDDAFDWTADK
jgi:hypothetical protein